MANLKCLICPGEAAPLYLLCPEHWKAMNEIEVTYQNHIAILQKAEIEALRNYVATVKREQALQSDRDF